MYASPAEPAAYADLAARFRPIFARIAEGAVGREQTRSLPFAEIAALRDAGFGAIRLPIARGGSGATLPQLFRLLVELGEADSNCVQILRAHFAFVEGRLNSDDTEVNDLWLPRIAANQLIGAAMAERTAATETTLALRREGEIFRLDGEKYYCTGTLYAADTPRYRVLCFQPKFTFIESPLALRNAQEHCEPLGTGGIGPLQFRLVGGRLPAGLQLDEHSGLLRGVPRDAPGDYELEIACASATESVRGKIRLLLERAP